MRRMSPLLALVALAALAGVASAAPSLQAFGTGGVTIAGDGATLVNDAGQYSGVYLKSKSQSSKALAAVDFSFEYAGATAGGAPRFSIPLNTGPDHYAFIDALNCGTPGLVSTEDTTCKVFLNFSGESFANWNAFAAAHPTWKVASSGIPFVIADQPGEYVISDIVLR